MVGWIRIVLLLVFFLNNGGVVDEGSMDYKLIESIILYCDFDGDGVKEVLV